MRDAILLGVALPADSAWAQRHDEWNHGTSGAEQDLSGYYDSNGDSNQNLDGNINEEANDFFVGGTKQDLDNYAAGVSTPALPFHSPDTTATVTMEKQLQEEGEIAVGDRRLIITQQL